MADSYGKAASANSSQGAKTTYNVKPVTVSYGGYGGHGAPQKGGYAAPSYGNNSYGQW
jgi:hypothetical protein